MRIVRRSPFHKLNAHHEAFALPHPQRAILRRRRFDMLSAVSSTRTNGFASRTVRSVVLPSALPRPCVWLWGGVA